MITPDNSPFPEQVPRPAQKVRPAGAETTGSSRQIFCSKSLSARCRTPLGRDRRKQRFPRSTWRNPRSSNA